MPLKMLENARWPIDNIYINCCGVERKDAVRVVCFLLKIKKSISYSLLFGWVFVYVVNQQPHYRPLVFSETDVSAISDLDSVAIQIGLYIVRNVHFA